MFVVSLMSTTKGGAQGDSDMIKDLTLNPSESIPNNTRPTMSEPENRDSNASTTTGRASEVRNTEITAQDRRDLKSDTINYDAQRLIGHGSFGAVFLAKVVETDELVAIKKVLQDKRFKNRELQIMRLLAKQPHPFIVQLKHHFVSKGSKSDDVYLNLVLEFVPETIYSITKYFNRRKESIPIFSVKLYMYQLARALGHIHGMGICHRDIKPHNLLVDPMRQVLKLCDFGSAKAFVAGEPNVAYICSRFYRAPELIFGSTDYTTAIDVWSQGCVFAELLIGSPIFPGSSGVDQLVEIIKVLGTPAKDELKSMNPNYQEFKFPQIRAYPWGSIFKASTPPESIDLIGKLLAYVPVQRLTAIEACTHPFFDELRQPNTTMPDKSPLHPELFQFTKEEMTLGAGLLDVLVPAHIKAAQAAAGGSSSGGTGDAIASAATNPNSSVATTASSTNDAPSSSAQAATASSNSSGAANGASQQDNL